MLVQNKREAFHVQLRKTTREHIFQKKRISYPCSFLSLERFDNPLTLFEELQKELPNYCDQHEIVLPQMLKVAKQYQNDQEQSMMSINDDDREVSLHVLQAMLRYLASLTTYVKVKFDELTIFDMLISILNASDDYCTVELLCCCFYNLLQDFQEMEGFLLKCDIVTKLKNKFLDGDVISDIEKLKPFFQLLSSLKTVGYQEFYEVNQLLHRLHEQNASQTIYKYFFEFLNNVTNISNNKKLFELLIENQYIEWTVKLLFQQNEICNTLYQFLMNMSMSDYGSKMIERGVLSVIQVHLGEPQFPQVSIYSILHNLTMDDSISVYQSGILTRVRHQFEIGFPQAEYITELLHFVVVSFQFASEKILKELLAMNLADCLTIYITDSPFLDMELSNNIFCLLVQIFKTQSSKSKYNLLRKLKSNPQFIMRIGQLGAENDKLVQILNYFYQ